MNTKNALASIALMLVTTGTFAAGYLAIDPIAEHIAEASVTTEVQMTTEVQQAINPVAEGTGSQVKAKVQDGSVLLVGSATSEDVIRQLLEVAANIPGVREVRSEMTVKPI